MIPIQLETFFDTPIFCASDSESMFLLPAVLLIIRVDVALGKNHAIIKPEFREDLINAIFPLRGAVFLPDDAEIERLASRNGDLL